MRLSWIAAAFGLAAGLTVSAQAIAQVQTNPQTPQYGGAQPYETPRYTPMVPMTLDKNFGLPAFGMPGADMPQQRTMVPDPVPPVATDAVKRAPDFVLPKAAEWRPGGTKMETPLYTTSEGGLTGDRTQSETGGFGTQAAVGRRVETGELETGGFGTGGFETRRPARR